MPANVKPDVSRRGPSISRNPAASVTRLRGRCTLSCSRNVLVPMPVLIHARQNKIKTANGPGCVTRSQFLTLHLCLLNVPTRRSRFIGPVADHKVRISVKNSHAHFPCLGNTRNITSTAPILARAIDVKYREAEKHKPIDVKSLLDQGEAMEFVESCLMYPGPRGVVSHRSAACAAVGLFRWRDCRVFSMGAAWSLRWKYGYGSVWYSCV